MIPNKNIGNLDQIQSECKQSASLTLTYCNIQIVGQVRKAKKKIQINRQIHTLWKQLINLFNRPKIDTKVKQKTTETSNIYNRRVS